MPFFPPDYDTPMAEVVPGVMARRLVDEPTGSGAVTIGELEMQPGGKLPLHKHRVEEVLIVRSGRGRFELDGELSEITEGTVVLIPGNKPHSLANEATDPLRIYFIYPAVNVAREWL